MSEDLLDYLEAYELKEAPVKKELEWHKIHYLGTGVKKVAGVLADNNKFSCEAFPEQNLASFKSYFVYTNLDARSVYLSPYNASNPKPPDCWSTNGVHPHKPLVDQGQVILTCAKCPHNRRFNDNGKCNTDAHAYAVAVFESENGPVYVPWTKHFPITSFKSFKNLVAALADPAMVNDRPIFLPTFAREVEVFAEVETRNGQDYRVWGFRPTGKFAPPEILKDLKQIHEMLQPKMEADMAVRLLEAPAPVAQITGQTLSVTVPNGGDASNLMLIETDDIPF